MRLRPFELAEPASLAEAVRLAADAGDETRVVGGGTALLPMLRLGLLRAGRLVSLHRVPGLAEIDRQGGELALGALVTAAALHRAPLAREGWSLLAEAAGRVASPAIRSMATVGGNLAYAEAASDLAPALLALDAVVEAQGPDGQRRLPIAELFRGFYETALAPGELVTGVRLGEPPRGARSGYVKFCPRSAEDKPLIGVAVVLGLGVGRRVEHVRIALAGAAPTPVRARRAEAALGGEALGDAAIAAAAAAAAAEAEPLSDLMGSADYRRRMVRVWTGRLLTALRDGEPTPRPR